MIKVRVKCTVFVDIELPDDFTDDQTRFYVEENGCPGTGAVGSAIDAAMKYGEDTSTCWACSRQGTNEIVSIERHPGSDEG